MLRPRARRSRTAPILVAFVLAGLLPTGTAHSGILNWEGTSTLLLGDFPQADFTGGGVASVNGSASLGHVNSVSLGSSRGNITASFTLPVTDPEQEGNSIAKLTFIDIRGGDGTFAPISGGGSLTKNTLPVRGIVRLCLINNGCPFTSQLVLTQTANGTSTFGVGIGGLLTVTVLGNSISVECGPWTIGTTTVIDERTTPTNQFVQFFTPIVLSGFAHSPISGTTNTATPGGVVQLISPNQITSNLPTGSNEKIASAITFVLRFVPEPGALLLLGSGAAGLLLLGRSRMRS